MNKPKDDGPLAFPSEPFTSDLRSGMTLRDYFAAKAMQGLVVIAGDHRYGEVVYDEPRLVKRAYSLADAMLEERKK